jgi:hypothetical protein
LAVTVARKFTSSGFKPAEEAISSAKESLSKCHTEFFVCSRKTLHMTASAFDEYIHEGDGVEKLVLIEGDLRFRDLWLPIFLTPAFISD